MTFRTPDTVLDLLAAFALGLVVGPWFWLAVDAVVRLVSGEREG